MFIQQAISDPGFYFSWIAIVAFSICCHEYAHAYTALKVGDDTAAREGHLTLNPAVQMGMQSLIMLILLGIAWGSVPVNPAAVRTPKHRAMISFAGPLTNLILCAVFSLLYVIAQMAGQPSLEQFFLIGGVSNGALFTLNMLPVPILDGFSVISAFRPDLEGFARRHAGSVFAVFILLLWITPLGSLIFDVGAVLLDLFSGIFQIILPVG